MQILVDENDRKIQQLTQEKVKKQLWKNTVFDSIN